MKGMQLAGEKGFSVYEQLWTRPSLTVIAFDARPDQGLVQPDHRSRRPRACRCARSRTWTAGAAGRRWSRSSRRSRPTGRRSRPRPSAHAVVDDRPGGPGLRGGPPRAEGRLRQGDGHDRRRRLDRLRRALRASCSAARPASSWASRTRSATRTPRTRACTSATGSSRMRSAVHLYDELSRVSAAKQAAAEEAVGWAARAGCGRRERRTSGSRRGVCTASAPRAASGSRPGARPAPGSPAPGSCPTPRGTRGGSRPPPRAGARAGAPSARRRCEARRRERRREDPGMRGDPQVRHERWPGEAEKIAAGRRLLQEPARGLVDGARRVRRVEQHVDVAGDAHGSAARSARSRTA